MLYGEQQTSLIFVENTVQEKIIFANFLAELDIEEGLDRKPSLVLARLPKNDFEQRQQFSEIQ
jgi:hypothetical protein